MVDLRLVRVSVMDGVVMLELLKSYGLKEVREIPASAIEYKQLLRGTDVAIGGYGYEEQREVANAASELGIPFITYPVITTVLPDGIPFDELEFPAGDHILSPVLNLLVRAFQMIELLKLFVVGTPLFAPDALVVHLEPDTLDLRLERVKLSVKRC